MEWTLHCGSQKLSVVVRLVPVDDFLDYDDFNVIAAPTRRRRDPAVSAVVPMSRRILDHGGSSWHFTLFSKVLMCQLPDE